MVDLLTHVLVGYVLATVLSWRVERITPPLVTVAMLGATIPDLNRLTFLFPPGLVRSTLDVPFTWSAFHTLGGALFLAAIAAVVVSPRYGPLVFALVLLGASSHLFVDSFIFRSFGRSSEFLWPLSDARYPIDGFYKSYDRWPALAVGSLAAVVWAVTRRRERATATARTILE